MILATEKIQIFDRRCRILKSANNNYCSGTCTHLGLAVVLFDHPALLVTVVRVLNVVFPLQREVPPALEVHPVLVKVVHLCIGSIVNDGDRWEGPSRHRMDASHPKNIQLGYLSWCDTKLVIPAPFALHAHQNTPQGVTISPLLQSCKIRAFHIQTFSSPSLSKYAYVYTSSMGVSSSPRLGAGRMTAKRLLRSNTGSYTL